MKTCTRCKTLKQLDDYGKDKRSSDERASSCKMCESERGRILYHKNREKELARSKEYRNSNIEKEKLRGEKFRSLNIEKLKASRKEYKNTNKDSISVKNLEYSRKNAGKVNAKTRKYQASKKQRTPNWLSEDSIKQMEQIYILAKVMEKETNKKFHVDHIVPLQGKNVSGLHVPWNLQILESNVNQSKGNRY